MPTITADRLRSIGSSIFQAAGVPGPVAERVSASLVESNLVGHDSHGVIRITEYLADLRQGLINPRGEIQVLKDTPTMALLDANWQFGQVAAAEGMAIAIEKAKASQVAAVGIRRSYHIGRLGEYSLMAAEKGCVGMIGCNSWPCTVSPFGGIGRALSPNPISYAAPAGRRAPFLLDFATTMCAEGKLNVARVSGKSVPEGWILDKEGRPTTNPADFYDGGVILPMGGHKGYALCLLLDILGGALTGHGCTCLPEFSVGNGVFMMALDVQAFRPLAEFQDTADRLFEAIKSGPTAPGFDEILVPGEPEFRTREARERCGIPLAETIWQRIVSEAVRVGVDIEKE